MWLNERARQTGGAGYECAVVRLCRDGTVRINGLVINEKGEIEP